MKAIVLLVCGGLVLLWLVWAAAGGAAGSGGAGLPAVDGARSFPEALASGATADFVESPAVESPPAESQDGARSALDGAAALSVRLASASQALSRLAVVLEREDGSGERRLSLRDPVVLQGVAPGRYRLRCVERSWRGDEVRFALPPGARAPIVDLPAEPLGPWRGRVLDADTGDPLPRALFVLETRGTIDTLPIVGEAGRGEFALEGGSFSLACGETLGDEARLRVDADGYGTFETPWTPWDGFAPVDLGDVGLVRAGARPTGLAGRVVDAASGEPLVGARVIAVDVGTRVEELWTHAGSVQGALAVAAREARTDGRGEFVLGVEGPELVRLAAFLPSHGLALGEPLPCRPGALLAMTRRAGLRGRVVTTESVRASGVLNGVFVSGDGTNALLELDEELAFELGGLAAGRVRVALQALEEQTGGGRVAAEVLVQGADVQEGEVTEVLLRYPAETTGPSFVGSVLLPDGVAFASLRAALWPTGEPSPSRFAVIDRAGNFTLAGPLPDSGWLFVGGASPDSSRGFVAATAWAGTGAPDPTPFDVRAASVRGRATREGSVAARASVVVAAADADPAWARAIAEGLSIATDEQGTFEIFGLRPGRYEIGRLGGARQTILVGEAGSAALEVRLE